MALFNPDIVKRVQVHVPFRLLRNGYLDLLLRERLNPEISFNHEDLDTFQQDEFLEVAKRLTGAGLSITFHAPFLDLRPGALDPKIRRVTIDRLQQVFDLVPFFRPRSVVCHPAFDADYYVSSERKWLENSIDTWRHFSAIAEQTDTLVVLENVYENHPAHLKPLLEAVASKRLRFCFDTGHFNVFSRSPLEAWIEAMSPIIAQLHVHDNNGTLDEHLPPGQGNFPFARFFTMLREMDIRPIITVEAHSEKNLRQALSNLEKMSLPDPA